MQLAMNCRYIENKILKKLPIVLCVPILFIYYDSIEITSLYHQSPMYNYKCPFHVDIIMISQWP